MLGIYALAVKAMQEPAINYPPQPQSWTFQAYMHAVPLNPFDPAVSGGLWGPALKQRIDDIYGNPADGTPQAAWKRAALSCWATCEHASPYFTTWHRWYLYYFERICRKLSGHQEFTLPYWNYASDNGPSLQLPEVFQQVSSDPTDPNPLYFDDRGLGFANGQATGPQNVPMNSGGFLPYPLTQFGPALSAKAMFPSDDAAHISGDPTDPVYLGLGYTGRLECVPHDNVHSFVGGWMQNVPSAAGDPIFFMHHCQIDRLYASWEAQSDDTYNWGTSASQPDEKSWKSKLGAFVDENGQVINVKLGDAMNVSSLGYTYDNLASPPTPTVATILATPRRKTSLITLAAMGAHKFTVQAGGTTVTLSPTARPEATAPASTPSTSHFLILSGVKLLRRPPAPLAVFINLPKGAQPRLNNPYYVGTLNLFNFDLSTGTPIVHGESNMNAGHAMSGGTVRFDITEALLEQRIKGLWDGGTITVTISTLGADTPGTAATYLSVQSATIVP
jgi:tyrosinase